MSITFEQALRSTEFHQTGGSGRPCTSKQGPLRWRRNGATKTWKRTPGKFQVPVKFGLRAYDYIDEINQEWVHAVEDCPLNPIHDHPTWSHEVAYGPCTKDKTT